MANPTMELWMSIIGISMAMSGIPQVICLLRRKTSDDISIIAWFLIIHGQVWWLYYGFSKNITSLIVSSFVGLVFSAGTTLLIFKYRTRRTEKCLK